MIEALKTIVAVVWFCLALAGATLEPVAAEEPLFVEEPAEELIFVAGEAEMPNLLEKIPENVVDEIILTDGSEEEIFSAGDDSAEIELLPEGIETEKREYWLGEPMEFVWVTFDSLNRLQLFTLEDAGDAGGFIYGKWVTPGFVLYRASEADATSCLGWQVDYSVEDERIRPKLNSEDDSTLFWNFPNLYEQLASMDKQIDEYLKTICQDLDDLWWFYENLQGSESEVFKRPHTMIQGIVKDIQDMEARIQDKLVERNNCYSDAIMKLHPERYE